MLKFAMTLTMVLASSATFAADGMRPANTLAETLALCRRTYDYVARAVPRDQRAGFAAAATTVLPRCGNDDLFRVGILVDVTFPIEF